MSSPFKSDPKTTTNCNNCQSELTYNSGNPAPRICSDCKDSLDEPEACSFELDVTVDATTKTAHAAVTVSHDQPVKVHIPPYDIQETSESSHTANSYIANSYTARIAMLTVTDEEGNVVAEEVWEETTRNVLRPSEECRLHIHHDKVVGCTGERSWNPEVDTTDLDGQELQFEVTFPAISDTPGTNMVDTITPSAE